MIFYLIAVLVKFVTHQLKNLITSSLKDLDSDLAPGHKPEMTSLLIEVSLSYKRAQNVKKKTEFKMKLVSTL